MRLTKLLCVLVFVSQILAACDDGESGPGPAGGDADAAGDSTNADPGDNPDGGGDSSDDGDAGEDAAADTAGEDAPAETGNDLPAEDVAADTPDDPVTEDVGADAPADSPADSVGEDTAGDTAADSAGDTAADSVDDTTADSAGDAAGDVTADAGGDATDTADDGPPACPEHYEWNGTDCTPIDHCSVNNGACGDPTVWSCNNLEGSDPDCTYLATVDADAIRPGALDFGGAAPSALVVAAHRLLKTDPTQPVAFPVLVNSSDHAVIAAAARTRTADPNIEGRVVVIGHEALFYAFETATDTREDFVVRVIAWAGANAVDPVVGLDPALTDLPDVFDAHDITWETADGSDLDDIDVYITTAYPERSPAQLQEIDALLQRGGGLVMGGHAWNWAASNPGVDVFEGFPGNQVLAATGLAITSENVGTDALSAGPSLESTAYGLWAAVFIVSQHNHLSPLEEPGRSIARRSIERAMALLPPYHFVWPGVRNELLRRPQVRATPGAPYLPGDDAEGLLASRLLAFLAERLPAAEVPAVPAAEDFPGTIPAEAPRVSLEVDLDGDFPGAGEDAFAPEAAAPVWLSTGAWAPAGEVVTVNIPPDLADAGLVVQIGSHTYNALADGLWNRFPVVLRRDALDQTVTETASAFGGLVYILVPAGSALGPFTVTLDGVVRAPFFDAGGAGDPWETARDYEPPWAELQGARYVLTVPADAVRTLDDPAAVTGFLDDFMDAQSELAGASLERARRERLVLDTQVGGGYSLSYPRLTDDNGALSLLEVDSPNLEQRWGFFSILSYDPAFFGWAVPNSVPALGQVFAVHAFETVLGVPLNEAHDMLTIENRVDTFETYLAVPDDFYARWTSWAALETFLQLQEGFGWDLLSDLFGTYRSLPGGSLPGNDQARIDQWVVRSSVASGVDLREFYGDWYWPYSAAGVVEAGEGRLPWRCSPLADDWQGGYSGSIQITATVAGTTTDTCTGTASTTVTRAGVAQIDPDSGSCTFTGPLSGIGTIGALIDGQLEVLVGCGPASGTLDTGVVVAPWSGTLAIDGEGTLTIYSAFSGLADGPPSISYSGFFELTRE